MLLVFAESYGAITYDAPDVAAGLRESRAALADAVRDSGRQVVSAYVDSPTFGGGSWLAHLSLISGVEVRDQFAYTSLMASQRETILTNFKRRGYRTVALMPGMRQAWPEGAFYRFDQIYGRDLLEYKGPQFGWWSIPDQYALAKLDAPTIESWAAREAATRPSSASLAWRLLKVFLTWCGEHPRYAALLPAKNPAKTTRTREAFGKRARVLLPLSPSPIYRAMSVAEGGLTVLRAAERSTLLTLAV